MQFRDKFLIQTTTVDPNTDVDDLPSDTVRELVTLFYRIISKNLKIKIDQGHIHFALQFNKDSGRLTEELKLRVVYVSPTSPQGSTRDDTVTNSTQNLDTSSVSFSVSPIHPLLRDSSY